MSPYAKKDKDVRTSITHAARRPLIKTTKNNGMTLNIRYFFELNYRKYIKKQKEIELHKCVQWYF